jgi:CPA2 family monovalent cation:H+ antiporter-2
MIHHTPLLTTLVSGLGLAFLFALLAHRLRLPLIAGYLVAGVVIGPFTPGYVADAALAAELAELGVILLMFGVGLHFSLRDLLSVRAVAVPGALGQIAVATLAGTLLGWSLGWGWGAGVLFGLALSVASTVVLLRALGERDLVETERGRIAVGWLIVEDLVMVVALVVIPSFAGFLGGTETSSVAADVAGQVVAEMAPDAAATGGLGYVLLVTLLKVAVFVAVMLVVGRRVIPWVLHGTAHLHSRELFRLSVLAIALGVAYGATRLFGVSFALGAFFAGLVMATSTFSQVAARETLPLRDAFAVLFFVSVGMLFDPAILLRAPLAVLGTVLIIVVVKSAAAFLIVRAAGHDRATALTVSAALAQIGEFSFILATLGLYLDVLPEEARDLIVAGAIVSIVLNPFAFAALDRLLARAEARTKAGEAAGEAATPS